VADLAEEVAAASAEQSRGLEQINIGINQIDQVTQSNTATAEESAAAAEELDSQSHQLKSMIGRFTLRRAEEKSFDHLHGLSPELLELIRAELRSGSSGQAAAKTAIRPAKLAAATGAALAEDEDFREF
jgi:hypothetical protein